MPMGMPQQQQGQPPQGQGQGQGQGQQGGANTLIKDIDNGLGMMTEALAQIPQAGQELAKKMDGVRQGYRSVIDEAMAIGQGGGGSQPQQRQPQQQPQAVPERGQGTPVGPAGRY